MHALLVSIGSDGDVFPFVALGRELHARGHNVTLASNEPYAELADASGFGFCNLVSRADTNALFQDPDIWHPWKSGLAGALWGRRFFASHYRLLEGAAVRFPKTMVLSYPPVFAARVLQERLGLPLISILPMPWMLLSRIDPPAPPSAAAWPVMAHRSVARLIWRLGERLTDFLLGRQLNTLRRQVGLEPIRNIYRWCFSPQLTVGLFPEWFASPQSDWPGKTRLTNFPVYDGETDNSFDPELKKFLERGTPPVVFTFGTGMMHSGELFKLAVDACGALGVRGLFVTRFSDQLPPDRAPFIHHCTYAPFAKLFPFCAAVVHHGGIGTTARALGAGVPQLIIPLAWDQPDNAIRVKRLGAGDWVNPRKIRKELVPKLSGLLAPEMKSLCEKSRRHFNHPQPLANAADLIEAEARKIF